MEFLASLISLLAGLLEVAVRKALTKVFRGMVFLTKRVLPWLVGLMVLAETASLFLFPGLVLPILIALVSIIVFWVLFDSWWQPLAGTRIGGEEWLRRRKLL